MFRAVGNRCAVNLAELNLPVSVSLAVTILENRGFKILNVNLIKIARSCIGKAEYKLGATQEQAPHIFDCSSFTKWIYGHAGINLHRRTIQQYEQSLSICTRNIRAGDLVFKSGQRHNWYRDDSKLNMGHIGIATGDRTIIHAANHGRGVTESPLEEFLNPKEFRGIGRIIPDPQNTLTFETPPHREIETSDDFFWVIVQTLPKT